jgi:type II secretory pathway pseudopilin PulG
MNARAPGFTLVEILIVSLLGVLLLGSIYQTLTVQERTSRAQSAMLSNNQVNRMIMDVVVAEIREISASDGDLVLATPDSLAFRGLRKAGVICGRDALLGGWFDVYEFGLAFEAGDSLLIFADRDTTAAADDGWILSTVDGTGSAACAASWDSYTTARISVPLIQQLFFAGNVHLGAPVRSFTRWTYGIYRLENEWVLGRRDADDEPVALAGPLAPPPNGLRFRYFDGLGVEIPVAQLETRAADVVRIAIKVQGRIQGATGLPGGISSDSLVSQIYLRNN